MKILKILIVVIIFSSCDKLERYKEEKAIKIVQQAKFGKHNLIEKFNIGGFFLDENMTNLEMAGMLTSKFPNKEFKWTATKDKGVKKGILKDNEYAVFFSSSDYEVGILWIFNTKNNTIRLYNDK